MPPSLHDFLPFILRATVQRPTTLRAWWAVCLASDPPCSASSLSIVRARVKTNKLTYAVHAQKRTTPPSLSISLLFLASRGRQGQTVKLVVDSMESEKRIRALFHETLLGPEEIDPAIDFDPSVPMDTRPDIAKELSYFRSFNGK